MNFAVAPPLTTGAHVCFLNALSESLLGDCPLALGDWLLDSYSAALQLL